MRVRELRISYHTRPDLPIDSGKPIVNVQDAVAVLAPILACQPVEVFGLLCLTTRLRVIAYHELSRGTLDTTLVQPREVFQAALLANAAQLVLGHNHPSGDPTPSLDDLILTHRLTEAGVLLGISVADHIVIGHGGRYFSFRERRLLGGAT